MSYLDWHVGMKVVCVNGAPRFVEKFPYRAVVGTGLREGQIYTIRALTTDIEDDVGVYLHEVKSPLAPLKNGKERPYFAGRFRPLKTRQTDISIFTAMLTGSRQGVSA